MSSVSPSTDQFRKFLVVVDSTPECMNALRFAAMRAVRTGGTVCMLYVINDVDDVRIWGAVAEKMREEAWDEAEDRMNTLAAAVRENIGLLPAVVIREGDPKEQVLSLIREDPNIRVLVLGAGTEEGPGPLVTAIVGQMAGRMSVPVTVVPGALSMEDIDEIA